jgi:GUN4-like
MAKKNQGIFILALLLVAGLFSVAGAIVWLVLRQNAPLAPGGNNSTAPSSASNGSSTPTQSVDMHRSLDEVALKSDRSVDYTQLREYLRAKDWRNADRETYLRLLDAAGPLAQARGMIPQSEVNVLSCADLRTIDQLWNAAPDSQQGFTVQMNIYRAIGSDYRKMYDAIGWKKLSSPNTWAFEWRYNTQNRRMEFVPGREPNYINPSPGYLPTVEIGYNLDVAFSGALKRCGF